MTRETIVLIGLGALALTAAAIALEILAAPDGAGPEIGPDAELRATP